MAWLYRYEAKGIQSWIVGSERLAEMRGASALVDEIAGLAKERAAKIPAASFKYAAAGGGTIEFATQTALEAFASDWLMELSAFAPGLQVVHGWGPATEQERMYAALGAARNQPLPDLPEAGPWTARSSRTGRPAFGRAEGTFIDAATRAKQRRVEKAKREGDAPLGPEQALRHPDYGGEDAWRFLEDLHHRAWADEPIAVVHADGNGIGQRILKMTPDEIAAFATKLDKATKQAACDAVRWLADRYERDQNRGNKELPARPIVLGGDDFTFIVQAKYAFGFLEQWLRSFEKHTQAKDEPLNACGGIAIVANGFPFSDAHEIAEDACKRAKKVLRGSGHSGYAFERVTTSDKDEAAHSGVYAVAGTQGRPIADVFDVSDALDDLGVGSVRQWVGLRSQDESQAKRLWERLRQTATEHVNGASPKTEKRDAWHKVVAKLPDGGDAPLSAANARLLSDALTLRRLNASRHGVHG